MEKRRAPPLLIAICFFSLTGCTRSTQSVSSPVTLLPAAVTAVRETAQAKGVHKKYWVRVEIHLPGGPETLDHSLDIELDPPRAQDREFESGGLPVVVLADQVEMLKGCTVDHGEKEGKVGFKIKNPNFEGDNAWKWLQELERRRGR
jgi:Fe-S cluster assembly iron-binding protein IscA